MAGTDVDGPESAELRLLGSPFMRFRMSCVAALNWGTYGGLVAGMELCRAAAGAAVGVKLDAGAVGAEGAPASGGLSSAVELESAMFEV